MQVRTTSLVACCLGLALSGCNEKGKVEVPAGPVVGNAPAEQADDGVGRMTDAELIGVMEKKARDMFPPPGSIVSRTLLARGQLHGKAARVEQVRFLAASAHAFCEYAVYEHDPEWKRYTGVLITIGWGTPEGDCDYGWERICMGCSLTGQDKFTYVDFRTYLEKEGFTGKIDPTVWEIKKPYLKSMAAATSSYYGLDGTRGDRARVAGQVKRLAEEAARFTKSQKTPPSWCEKSKETLKAAEKIMTETKEAAAAVLTGCKNFEDAADSPKGYTNFEKVCKPSPSTAMEAQQQGTFYDSASEGVRGLCP